MKPMVMVTVEGGIATAEVITGEVEIIQWDWDVIDETEEPKEIVEMMRQARRLPDDWPQKGSILNGMAQALAQLEDEG